MKKLLLIIVALSFFSCSHIPETSTPSVTPEQEFAMTNPDQGEVDREPADFQSCLEAMNTIISYHPHAGPAGQFISKAKTLKELEAAYGGENLINIQRRLSNDEIKLNNANVKKLLEAPYTVNPITGKKSAIAPIEASEILKAITNSNSNKNHYGYDPAGTIGFCFGRATIGHMEAIIRNVHPESIKKIWIAGDMGVWGHHVAPMVYTTEGWLILDTNLGRAVKYDAWMATYAPMKANGAKDIMVFTTQAGRFGPYDTRTYNAIDLFNTRSPDYKKAQDYFNGYFHDYFESLDNVDTTPLRSVQSR